MTNFNINTNIGRVLLESNKTHITITNDKISNNSIIIATPYSNLINNVVAVADNGFCTLYPDVTPTSNTRINFLIIN